MEEGTLINRNSTHHKRSRKLREIKIIMLLDERGKIYCEACGFNFFEHYGAIGENVIEIHHTEPVHLMQSKGEFQKISDELISTLIPLCSNCHNIVHRGENCILSISELKELIRKSSIKMDTS